MSNRRRLGLLSEHMESRLVLSPLTLGNSLRSVAVVDGSGTAADFAVPQEADPQDNQEVADVKSLSEKVDARETAGRSQAVVVDQKAVATIDSLDVASDAVLPNNRVQTGQTTLTDGPDSDVLATRVNQNSSNNRVASSGASPESTSASRPIEKSDTVAVITLDDRPNVLPNGSANDDGSAADDASQGSTVPTAETSSGETRTVQPVTRSDSDVPTTVNNRTDAETDTTRTATPSDVISTNPDLDTDDRTAVATVDRDSTQTSDSRSESVESSDRDSTRTSVTTNPSSANSVQSTSVASRPSTVSPTETTVRTATPEQTERTTQTGDDSAKRPAADSDGRVDAVDERVKPDAGTNDQTRVATADSNSDTQEASVGTVSRQAATSPNLRVKSDSRDEEVSTVTPVLSADGTRLVLAERLAPAVVESRPDDKGVSEDSTRKETTEGDDGTSVRTTDLANSVGRSDDSSEAADESDSSAHADDDALVQEDAESTVVTESEEATSLNENHQRPLEPSVVANRTIRQTFGEAGDLLDTPQQHGNGWPAMTSWNDLPVSGQSDLFQAVSDQPSVAEGEIAVEPFRFLNHTQAAEENVFGDATRLGLMLAAINHAGRRSGSFLRFSASDDEGRLYGSPQKTIRARRRTERQRRSQRFAGRRRLTVYSTEANSERTATDLQGPAADVLFADAASMCLLFRDMESTGFRSTARSLVGSLFAAATGLAAVRRRRGRSNGIPQRSKAATPRYSGPTVILEDNS